MEVKYFFRKFFSIFLHDTYRDININTCRPIVAIVWRFVCRIFGTRNRRSWSVQRQSKTTVRWWRWRSSPNCTVARRMSVSWSMWIFSWQRNRTKLESITIILLLLLACYSLYLVYDAHIGAESVQDLADRIVIEEGDGRAEEPDDCFLVQSSSCPGACPLTRHVV